VRLTAKQAPHRPGISSALGLRAGGDVFLIISQTRNEKTLMATNRITGQLRFLRALGLTALLWATAASPSLAITYTTIDYPGSVNTTALGIDGNNIVGAYDTGPVDDPITHGFLYNGTTYTDLDALFGTPGAIPGGIDGNNIVGQYSGATNSHGFLYNGSTLTNVDDPLGTHGNIASGISGNNIVGTYYDSATSHGFLYNGSTYTTLDDPLAMHGTAASAISGNNIVGYYIGSGDHGFLYNGTTYTTLDDPLATLGTVANSVSGASIVGQYFNASGSHGFLFNGSIYTTLDDPLAGSATVATGISGNHIVGYYIDALGKTHGFLTTVPVPGDYNGNGIVDAADYTVWRDTLGSTTDLRANGDNSGASAGKIDQADFTVWKTNFGNHAGSGSETSAVVPEPASATLFLVGFMTACAIARRNC
jgi:hypothetical protein